jgi:hypothetical protein
MNREIYESYRRGNASLEMTSSLIQELLLDRLRPEFRRIWVQGSTSRLLFTIFDSNGYTMRSINTGGLRQFRPDANLNDEIVIMETFLENLRTGILSEFIS